MSTAPLDGFFFRLNVPYASVSLRASLGASVSESMFFYSALCTKRADHNFWEH